MSFHDLALCADSRTEKVRILIKDIEELRASKLHASLRELNEYHEAVRIPNASAAELNRSAFHLRIFAIRLPLIHRNIFYQSELQTSRVILAYTFLRYTLAAFARL